MTELRTDVAENEGLLENDEFQAEDKEQLSINGDAGVTPGGGSDAGGDMKGTPGQITGMPEAEGNEETGEIDESEEISSSEEEDD